MDSPRRWTVWIVPLALAALLAAACSSDDDNTSTPSSNDNSGSTAASDLAPVHGEYHPKIDPADFVAQIDNPYFPLKPGTGFHYKGVAEDGKTPQTDDMVVTSKTKTIMGVKATVVSDIVSSHGKQIERTFDWYAQDKAGNVWYMGEDTRELEHGKYVKQDDSWEAGVDGAEPGIIMPGTPRQGDEYRQEYYPDHAEDQAKVLGSGGTVKVPAGTYQTTLMTEETAPTIEPDVAERKWYVSGIGDVEEHTVRGDKEHIVLVSITH